MRLYNCRVSLGANNGNVNPHHEKPLYGIPKAEVVLLRAIHGKDAVTDIQDAGVTDKSDMAIYRALADEFTGYPKYTKLIEQLFNVRLSDITSDLDGLEEGLGGDTVLAAPAQAPMQIDQEIDLPPEPPKTARVPVTME